MGGFSLWHWLIVLLVVLILFGRGRVSEIMGDFGKGIKSFKQGLNEDDKPAAPAPPPTQISQQGQSAPDAAPAPAPTPSETASSSDKS